MRTNSGLAWFVTLILSLSVIPLWGQTEAGRIVSTILDSTGAAVPDAVVKLTDEGTGIQRSAKSSASGAYAFPVLQPGSYTVEATALGFKAEIRKSIPVHVQQAVTMDLSLVPGSVSEHVDIGGEVPLLQAEDAALGQTIGEKQVNDLPLNERNWAQLAQLSTGVTVAQGRAGDQSKGYFSANGVSYLQNYYRLNRLSNNNEMYYDVEPYSVLSEYVQATVREL